MVKILALSAFLLFICLHVVDAGRVGRFAIDGHVSHGLNNFNGELIADLAASSNIFNEAGALYEIGVFNPDPSAINSSRITATTSFNSLMASTDADEFQKALGFPKGVGPYNIPLQDTGVLTVLSQNLLDRRTPSSFASTKTNIANLLAYLPSGADKSISLRDWNRASARIINRCGRDGTSVVDIRLKGGFPEAIYTAWDVGVSDALTSKEALAVGPLGGVVNVIITDKKGNGRLRRNLNYCLFDGCKGSKRCTIYVSLLYHIDHMNYGASFALDAAGPAVGTAGANQIQFYVNGKNRIPVQNPFRVYSRKYIH